MGKPPRGTPSVSAGCGYRVAKSGDGVVLYPTKNQGACKVKFGLGDATFTIDPKDPIDVIKSIITGDANGEYKPMIDFSKSRHTRSFDDISEVTKTVVDANGNSQDFTYKEVTGYKEESAEGDYEANGTSPYSDCVSINNNRSNW